MASERGLADEVKRLIDLVNEQKQTIEDLKQRVQVLEQNTSVPATSVETRCRSAVRDNPHRQCSLAKIVGSDFCRYHQTTQHPFDGESKEPTPRVQCECIAKTTRRQCSITATTTIVVDGATRHVCRHHVRATVRTFA